jgi:hypothetical protein
LMSRVDALEAAEVNFLRGEVARLNALYLHEVERVAALEAALRGVVIRYPVEAPHEDCWCMAPLLEPGQHYGPCRAARAALRAGEAK